MCQLTLLHHQCYIGALHTEWCVEMIGRIIRVIGGGGSDDMFFNSLVKIVGALCIPFFHFIRRKGIGDYWNFTTDEK